MKRRQAPRHKVAKKPLPKMAIERLPEKTNFKEIWTTPPSFRESSKQIIYTEVANEPSPLAPKSFSRIFNMLLRKKQLATQNMRDTFAERATRKQAMKRPETLIDRFLKVLK